MKVHIMRKEPYASWVVPSAGRVGIYKSLCGIKEPLSQAYGSIVPTCKKCIKIQEEKERS